MHLLGTIISVHVRETERQHALKYSRAVPIPKNVCNIWKWLKYIWWPFNKTGRICISYLQYAKKDVKLGLWNITAHISMETNLMKFYFFLLCWSKVHSKKANYFADIWKKCFKTSFKLPSIAGHGWDRTTNKYRGLKSPSQKRYKQS